MAVFLDTNVLAYAHDAGEETRQPVAAELIVRLRDQREAIVSTQVLVEFYAVVTRKFSPPMSRSEARALVDAYATWPTIQVDSGLIVAASRLEEEHKLSFWDAMIVEAAKRGGATRLLSEDLQDGRRFGDVRVENPFPTR